MRISDWSSDVCSSDLFSAGVLPPPCHGCRRPRRPTLKGPRRPSQEAAMAAVRALATTLVAPLVAAAITAAPATAQDAAQDARNLSAIYAAEVFQPEVLAMGQPGLDNGGDDGAAAAAGQSGNAARREQEWKDGE